jgi:transposase-like protein
VVEGLRGEDSIAELCRREGIVQNLYYRWSNDFLRQGRSGWLAIRPELRRHTRLRTCVARPALFDDFSRYIIAWKLCTTIRAEDVTATPPL